MAMPGRPHPTDTRRRIRGLLAAASVAVVAGSLIAAAGPAAQAAVAPAVTQHASATHEVATRVDGPPAAPTSAAPRSAAPTSAGAGSATGAANQRGARRIPGRSARAARPASPTVPPTAGATGATVLRSVNGTSSRDSEVTNFNARFEPPDQGLCVGNGYVVEPVNSAYNIYTTAGRKLRGPFNVNDLFNEGAQEFTSDPRCFYDQPTNTWFAVILFINADSTLSRVDLAVNTSGDPTSAWTQYRIDTSDDGRLGEPSHPGCPCLGDQPLLGIDQTNIYLSTNEFSLLGPEFNGAQVYAVAKSDLVAGRAHAHVVHFDNLSIGGAPATSVQPALSHGSPAAEFMMSSLDPNGTFDNRLGVWAMTNRSVVATGGTPTLSSVVITSEPYGIAPPAEQKGASSQIDSGDDRMQQTQFIGGRLWGALGTGVTIPGDPAERTGAAWFAVRPRLASGGLAGADIDRQGYVSRANQYLLYPAIQADPAGRAAMVFTSTGANRYPSAAFAVLPATGTAFGAPTVAAAGTGPYDPDATRWGDYSWAVLDPTDDAVWLATEYIPPPASQTSTGQRNWGTRFFEVSLG